MKLDQLLPLFEYKIVDGAEFLWKCWPNARFLNLENEHARVSIVHSIDTIFEVEIYATQDNEFPYRWVNPEFKDVYYAEAVERKLNPNQAWDDVEYTLIENEDEFLSKSKLIFDGYHPLIS